MLHSIVQICQFHFFGPSLQCIKYKIIGAKIIMIMQNIKLCQKGRKKCWTTHLHCEWFCTFLHKFKGTISNTSPVALKAVKIMKIRCNQVACPVTLNSQVITWFSAGQVDRFVQKGIPVEVFTTTCKKSRDPIGKEVNCETWSFRTYLHVLFRIPMHFFPFYNNLVSFAPIIRGCRVECEGAKYPDSTGNYYFWQKQEKGFS